MNGMEVLEIKEVQKGENNMNELESKPANVEEVIKAGWKTAEEMYTTANSSKSTWDRFMVDVRNAMSEKPNSGCFTDDTANLVVKLGSSHKAYYHPKVEKAFQLYLMKNQANQGRASDTIKEATMDNLEIGVAANYVMSSGSIEAAQQFAQLLISRTEAIAKSKQLESENQQLVHALEYDEVVGWKKWSDLKKELAQNFELLRHKINYTKLFDEVGLVENEDYKRKVMGFDKFPTVLISPEAEDMLWDWLDGHH